MCTFYSIAYVFKGGLVLWILYWVRIGETGSESVSLNGADGVVHSDRGPTFSFWPRPVLVVVAISHSRGFDVAYCSWTFDRVVNVLGSSLPNILEVVGLGEWDNGFDTKQRHYWVVMRCKILANSEWGVLYQESQWGWNTAGEHEVLLLEGFRVPPPF